MFHSTFAFIHTGRNCALKRIGAGVYVPQDTETHENTQKHANAACNLRAQTPRTPA